MVPTNLSISATAARLLAVTVLVSALLAVAPPPAAAATCSGVTVSTSDDLSALVAANPPGTSFCIEAGIHYGVSVRPKSGMVFKGEEGAVLSGAQVLTPGSAAQDGNGRWYWTGQTQEGMVYGSLKSGGNLRDTYPEELFVDGDTRLTHVDSYANLDAAGEWYFDYSADRIYLYDDPATFSLVETSVKTFAIAPEWWAYPSSADFPDDVVIENLVVEKYANPAQFGAIGHQANGDNGSDGWVVRHVEVRYTHGCGVRVMNGGTLEFSDIHHNGQIGASTRTRRWTSAGRGKVAASSSRSSRR